VHHSTVIEGSTLTENETRLLLEEGITPKGKPLIHSLMVKDHYNALQFIIKESKKPKPLTTAFIQQVNAEVMKSTGSLYNTPLGEVDASKGEFRKGNVSAGGSYFVNYDKVPAYTARLVQSLNEKMAGTLTEIEKIELSFSAHFDLVTIHPFYDGNGRTSRLLMNYLQALYSLPMAIVFKEDKNDYYTALQQARKQESMQPFYSFMYAQYRKHLLNEIQVFKEAINKDIPAKKSGGFSVFF
jgi:Fic family protein